jgi:hypothetical protein
VRHFEVLLGLHLFPPVIRATMENLAIPYAFFRFMVKRAATLLLGLPLASLADPGNLVTWFSNSLNEH